MSFCFCLLCSQMREELSDIKSDLLKETVYEEVHEGEEVSYYCTAFSSGFRL